MYFVGQLLYAMTHHTSALFLRSIDKLLRCKHKRKLIKGVISSETNSYESAMRPSLRGPYCAARITHLPIFTFLNLGKTSFVSAGLRVV